MLKSKMRFVIFFVLLLISNSSFAQTLVFEEKFINNKNEWKISDDGDFKIKIDKGHYVLKNKSSKGKSVTFLPKNFDAYEDDFRLELSMMLNSADSSEYALIWGATKKKRNYLRFKGIKYKIDAYNFVDKKWTIKQFWKKSQQINLSGKYNFIKIDKNANLISIFLNDSLIYKSGAYDQVGRRFGFWLGQNSEISVDNIRIYKKKKNIELIDSLNKNLKLVKLDSSINSVYEEFLPVVSSDGNYLYVARKKHPDNIGEEKATDIWYSVKDENDKWSQLKNISKPLNNSSFNFVISSSPDNNRLLVANTYKSDGSPDSDGLSITQRQKSGFSIPKAQKIEGYVNNSSFVNYFLSANNKILLCAIDNSEGYGEKDINVCFLKSDNSWSKPLNLGPVINTFGNESGIFLSADNKTIFFSSNGHPGYGNQDIFTSTRLDDSWKNWSKPKNLGPVVNGKNNELSYFLTAKGDYAYLASNGDIYKVKNQVPIEPVVLLSGKLLDKYGKAVEAEILCKDISSNEEVGSAFSNPETGEYKLVLQKGKVYNVDIKSEEYYTSNENIDLTKLNNYTELNRDLLVQPLVKDEIIKLKNISFEFNMSIIRVESYPEINRLVELLSKNPALKVEIAIHTDDDGPSDYNLKLSQSRADAIVNYIKSKGIKVNRIVAKGYGETKPLVPNDNSTNREINRRIEIKVL